MPARRERGRRRHERVRSDRRWRRRSPSLTMTSCAPAAYAGVTAFSSVSEITSTAPAAAPISSFVSGGETRSPHHHRRPAFARPRRRVDTRNRRRRHVGVGGAAAGFPARVVTTTSSGPAACAGVTAFNSVSRDHFNGARHPTDLDLSHPTRSCSPSTQHRRPTRSRPRQPGSHSTPPAAPHTRRRGRRSMSRPQSSRTTSSEPAACARVTAFNSVSEITSTRALATPPISTLRTRHEVAAP